MIATTTAARHRAGTNRAQDARGRLRAIGLVAALGAGLAALAPGDAPAQSTRIACGGTPYTIQSGDTLRAIAIRAYGRGSFEPIVEANRDVIQNPSLLRVGQRIVIPCPGTVVPAATAPAAAPAAGGQDSTRAAIVFQPTATPARTATPAPATTLAAPRVAAADPQAGTAAGAGGSDAPIRLLAASDIAPFVGRDRPEGGMLTEILGRALQLGVPGRAFEVSHDPDRSAHLTQMLPQDVHDIAYPWARPDCARPGQLDREQKWQCSDFTFSAALYETAIGYYFRAGDEMALASDPGLLFGRRLCRPAGSYAEDLEAESLVEPNVTRVAPPTAADCFAQLVAGRVDAVTMTTETAERAIAARGLDAQVVRSEALGAPLSLHAVALNTDADALAVLKAVDEALAQMREDGTWAEIVARHRQADALAAR